MKYYIVPREIAESLDLTGLRMSTSDGRFLLSESDLLPYGLERAVSEGSLTLTSPLSTPAAPTPAEEEAEPENSSEEEKQEQELSEEDKVESTNQEEEN